VLCVEGSHDAVMQSLLPKDLIIEHDFSRGPWWPDETYDAVWSVEFLEHVERKYMANYLPIFHKAAYIFITYSLWGGWHHVEVHDTWWWKTRMMAHGFVYDDELTDIIRTTASIGRKNESQHIAHRMLVFINPVVASLPQHSHVIGGYGCHINANGNWDGGVQCPDKEDELSTDFTSLLDCKKDFKRKKDEQLWNCKRNPRATIPSGFKVKR
jgi:hypothetical protein